MKLPDLTHWISVRLFGGAESPEAEGKTFVRRSNAHGLLRRGIILVLLLSIAFNVSLRPARADYWGAAEGAVFLERSMEEMYTKIKETTVASLQMAAVKLVMGRIQTLLTGSAGQYSFSGGSGGIITDWQSFIYGTAQTYATTITNDFFTTVSNGASSAAKERILDPAQKMMKNEDPTATSTPTPDLDKYVSEGKGENIFASGTSANTAYTNWLRGGMPQNSTETYYLLGKAKRQEALRQKEQQQIAEGTANQGFTSDTTATSNSGKYTTAGSLDGEVTTSTGSKVTVPSWSSYTTSKIKTPGSTKKSFTDEMLAMPMRILENAKSIPQVITAMVTNMITQVINQGLATVTDPIDNTLKGYSVSQMQSNVQSGINSSLKK